MSTCTRSATTRRGSSGTTSERCCRSCSGLARLTRARLAFGAGVREGGRMQDTEGLRKVGLAAMGAADLAAEKTREAASAVAGAAEQVRDTATQTVDEMASRGEQTRRSVTSQARKAVGRA